MVKIKISNLRESYDIVTYDMGISLKPIPTISKRKQQ